MSFALVPYRRRRPNGLARRTRDPFADVRLDADRLFNGFFGNWPTLQTWSEPTASHYSPRVDLRETETGFEIYAEVPGLSAKEINLSLSPEGDTLTLEGEKKIDRGENNEGYHHVERMHGSFSRVVSLPTAVDGEQVNAKLTDGVLTVTLTKREEEQPKSIQIGVE